MTFTAHKTSFTPARGARRFRTEGMNVFREIQAECGDLALMPVMPGLRNVLIFSPELAYDILVQHPERYQKPALAKRLFKSSFGNGIFFSEGDFWKRQRKLAQPALHHVRVNAYAEDMVAKTQKMMENWYSTIDIGAEMHTLTLLIVVNALFKTDVSGDAARIGASIGTLGEHSAKAVSSLPKMLGSLLPWLPTPGNRQIAKAMHTTDEIIYALIVERRKSGTDVGDLLWMFLQAEDMETGERMSDLQVRDELMTMFIAGHETSASALGWALVELAHHPEIEARLIADINVALNKRAPTLADLPAMPYLTQVVKETLRLYPPAIFIARSPLEPFTLGGARIGKRDLLQIVSLVIHRDSRWYADPDSFKPERWTSEFEKSLPKCAYIPFGTGPRVCIGNGFAMLEMQLVLASLLQRFHFDIEPESEPVRMSFGITLSFLNPVKMRVMPRNT